MKSLLLLLLVACSPMVYSHGIPNLAQVETNIYRSGQISTQEGWDYIKKLANGRKVHILKLNFDKEGSDALAVKMGFELHYLPIQPEGDQDAIDDVLGTLKQPDSEQVFMAVLVMTEAVDDKNVFLLVHCTHGQDRTGFIVGMHRVINDHWTKDRAYKEMREHHFHPELYGLHEAWEQFKP